MDKNIIKVKINIVHKHRNNKNTNENITKQFKKSKQTKITK